MEEEKLLSNIKEDLAINDDTQDVLIKRLITKVADHFKFEYNVDEIDSKYFFIIEDCVIKRYNRREAEGMKSVSIEGHSMTFEDKYEFESYHAKLTEELLGNNKVKRGKVVWY